MRQDQFLQVIHRDEAERRFRQGISCTPLEAEVVPLQEAHRRVLAQDLVSPLDVPGFDRASVDGFAVRASDTFGAFEEQAIRLLVNPETITPGQNPEGAVAAGTATPIATGAVIPRGADAVIMVEHTEMEGQHVLLWRPVAPGAGLAHAGTDVARGETILRQGTRLSSRETGILAALGVDRIHVHRRPRVAILSTGDELVPPGTELQPGQIHDCNGWMLVDAVRELGGEGLHLGLVPDDAAQVAHHLQQALERADLVLLSGGTSKGAGDLNYRVVEDAEGSRILAHGVALKPGKPICLATVQGTPVVILPGFPTSAIFTFHEFVAPVLRLWQGLPASDVGDEELVTATLPLRVNSEKGRTEYLLVGLVDGQEGLAAYPMGKGSGSVTTFSLADGFIAIPRQEEYLEAGTRVQVRRLGQGRRVADLVVIGSHCVGLDALLGLLAREGVTARFLAVGSSGGLVAARRGECDAAGIHLLDPGTNVYNEPYCTGSLCLVRGYGRLQGVVSRRDDPRFQGCGTAAQAVERALADPGCILMNRNQGSGTRILIDTLLGDRQLPGFAAEARSHNAVAAAVSSGRADWGVAIETVARQYDLAFQPLQEERFDLAVPASRLSRPGVQALQRLLKSEAGQARLAELGLHPSPGTTPGEVVGA